MRSCLETVPRTIPVPDWSLTPIAFVIMSSTMGMSPTMRAIDMLLTSSAICVNSRRYMCARFSNPTCFVLLVAMRSHAICTRRCSLLQSSLFNVRFRCLLLHMVVLTDLIMYVLWLLAHSDRRVDCLATATEAWIQRAIDGSPAQPSPFNTSREWVHNPLSIGSRQVLNRLPKSQQTLFAMSCGNCRAPLADFEELRDLACLCTLCPHCMAFSCSEHGTTVRTMFVVGFEIAASCLGLFCGVTCCACVH